MEWEQSNVNMDSTMFTARNAVFEPHVVVEPGPRTELWSRWSQQPIKSPPAEQVPQNAKSAPLKSSEASRCIFARPKFPCSFNQPLRITTMAPAKSARAKKFAAFEDKAVKGMHTSRQVPKQTKRTGLTDSVSCRL